MSLEKFNFRQVNVLIVDNDQYSISILGQILRGFGAASQTTAGTGEQAMQLLQSEHFELLLCESKLPDMDGADLVRWLRRSDKTPMRYMPVVMLTGYTQFAYVTAARDAGVNHVVRKPVSPAILLDHILWSAQSDRPLIETLTYIGPDRRFKFMGPPDGIGRRASDLPAEVGAATERNLSQDEIDSFMRPAKVVVT